MTATARVRQQSVFENQCCNRQKGIGSLELINIPFRLVGRCLVVGMCPTQSAKEATNSSIPLQVTLPMTFSRTNASFSYRYTHVCATKMARNHQSDQSSIVVQI
jgi:hypothetical protein